mmetsp:Transcript_4693/g.10096  ORF Transcript_4693/g.10096 Transcript_4693/m.10096 type:complete len:404 (+) Transcript_4693:314-1525(+)
MPSIHVGIPPPEWESWESHLVHFHHFESMPAEKSHLVKSPLFRCCGNHEWRVLMYPGGTALSGEGRVAFYLAHCSGPKISAKFLFLTRDSSGKVPFTMPSSEYFTFAEGNGQCWGLKDFAKHAKITDPAKNILLHGTLTVEVRIKPDDDYCCLNFIPRNAFAKNMLRSFMDEDTSDVIFEVKGRTGNGDLSPKSTPFHAHKLILRFCAVGSTLASLCEDCDESEPVPIVDVEPHVFKLMLYYIYGGEITAAEWKDRSRELIDAADRYGLKNLKIEAEAWYAKHHTITLRNVIDTLQYADEKNCFLLKEGAMNFILNNAREVLASDSFGEMPESRSIVREIISVATAKMHGGGGDVASKRKSLEDPTVLSINELRAILYDQGKDIDGPRNRLVAQLELKPETPP